MDPVVDCIDGKLYAFGDSREQEHVACHGECFERCLSCLCGEGLRFERFVLRKDRVAGGTVGPYQVIAGKL